MAPLPLQLLGDVLPSCGKIERGAVIYSEGEGALDCEDRAACAQRRLERKFAVCASVRLLAVALVSLAFAYFVLSCFDLTRERFRVAPLTRTLASGGSGACHGDGEGEEVGEDGGDAGGAGLWIGGHGGTGWEHLEGEGDLASLAWHEVDGSAVFRGTPGDPSAIASGVGMGWEHGTAAAQAQGSTAQLGQQGHADEGSGPLQYRRGAPHLGPGGLDGGDDDIRRINSGRKLLEGETLDMWRDRNMPSYFEKRVRTLFSRMMKAASIGQSLLGVLGDRGRLRLSYQLMKLLALQLGAICFVPDHVEHLRSDLGAVIEWLGLDILRCSESTPDDEHYHYRKKVTRLITLVGELRNPRPKTEDNDPIKYRKKTIAVVQTASKVVGYCLDVLDALTAHKTDESSPLPESLVEHQIHVLRAVYNVHAGQIAMDSVVRYFIVGCQRSTQIFPLLNNNPKKMRSDILPSLGKMLDEIDKAVESAGGLLPTSATPQAQHDTPGSTQPRAPQQVQTPTEPPSNTPKETDQRETVSHLQHSRTPTAMPGFQTVQAAASSLPLSHPIFPPSPVVHHVPQHPLQQPPSSPFPPPPFGSWIPMMDPHTRGMHGAPPQITPGLPVPRQAMLLTPTRVPERGGVSWPSLPVSAPWQERTSLPQPYPQPSIPALFGASAHAGDPRYPGHGGPITFDQTGQPSRSSSTARPTEQASGGVFGWDYGTAQGGTSQQQGAEEVEDMGGLLGDLLKGGLKIEDIFPGRQPRHQ